MATYFEMAERVPTSDTRAVVEMTGRNRLPLVPRFSYLGLMDLPPRSTSPLPLILMGQLEPVVRAGLMTAWPRHFELRDSTHFGFELVNEALDLSVYALVTARDEVADLCGLLPADLLVLGISSASWDTLICMGVSTCHFANPTPEELAMRILQPQSIAFVPPIT